MHISHLVPLEQSNFAYMLGSSGMASGDANSFKENVCENANTLAHVGNTWWCWHTLRRRLSLKGREGFGFLSPSDRACEAGFGAFEKMKRLFSIGWKVWRSHGSVTHQTLVLAASDTGPERPVYCQLLA